MFWLAFWVMCPFPKPEVDSSIYRLAWEWDRMVVSKESFLYWVFIQSIVLGELLNLFEVTPLAIAKILSSHSKSPYSLVKQYSMCYCSLQILPYHLGWSSCHSLAFFKCSSTGFSCYLKVCFILYAPLLLSQTYVSACFH